MVRARKTPLPRLPASSKIPAYDRNRHDSPNPGSVLGQFASQKDHYYKMIKMEYEADNKEKGSDSDDAQDVYKSAFLFSNL